MIRSAEFLVISVKTCEPFEIVSCFHFFFVWNRTQPETIEEESTVIEKGWCVIGKVIMVLFVVDVLVR